MFDVRDLSNTTIVLLIIMVFASAITVRAMVNPVPIPSTYPQSMFKTGDELAVDPNMAFYLLPQDVRVEVGNTFVVTVAVGNAVDMFGWQAYLRFDPTMLEALRVSLYPNNVFSSSITVSGAMANYDRAEFPEGPLQKVQNDRGWVLAGDCLLGADQPTFDGSGVLCQVEFKAISPGSTALGLLHDSADDFQTFNVNFDLKAITASSTSYSNIYVVLP